MALQRYALTSTATLLAGTAATPTAGGPLILDPAGPLYAALNGAGALRPFTDADTVSHQGLAN